MQGLLQLSYLIRALHIRALGIQLAFGDGAADLGRPLQGRGNAPAQPERTDGKKGRHRNG